MIYIFSTNPYLVTGGIAKSIQSLALGLDKINVQYKIIPTHEDGGKLRKYFLFFISLLRLFFMKKGSLIYLNAGGKVSIKRKGVIARVAKFLGHKILLHIHGPTLIDNMENPKYQIHFSKLCVSIDKVVVLTDWWKMKLSSIIPISKIEVLPNSITVEQEVVHKDKIGIKFNMKTMLFMGRLEKEKGGDLAILTLSKLKDDKITLLIAGEGPDKARMIKLVDKLHLNSRVTFLGWVNDSEKESLLNNTSLFILPSRLDSFGMGYLEAMEYSIPCVALKYRSIIDVFENEKEGLQFDLDGSNDDISKRIACGVENLFKTYDLYEKLAINSFNCVKNNYNAAKVAQDFKKIVGKLI